MQCSFKITTETSYNFLAAVGVRSITHSAHSGHIAVHFISLITNTSVATVQSAGAALSPAAWSRPLSVVSYYIIYLPTLRCDLYPDPDQYLYDPRIVSRLRVTTAAVSSRRKHEIFLLSPNIFLTRAMFRPPLRGGAAGPRGGGAGGRDSEGAPRGQEQVPQAAAAPLPPPQPPLRDPGGPLLLGAHRQHPDRQRDPLHPEDGAQGVPEPPGQQQWAGGPGAGVLLLRLP